MPPSLFSSTDNLFPDVNYSYLVCNNENIKRSSVANAKKQLVPTVDVSQHQGL